jgi:branched-chain amino acid transport system ATP-binding protein
MLEARDVRKSFNGFAAIGGVSLTVPERGITALIGPNGAGKSTLFNLLTGHLRADAGTVSLQGRDITAAAPHAICRMGVGRSFQHTNIFRKLTVFENVQAALIAHGGQARNFWGRAETLYRDEAWQLLGSLGLADQAEAIGDSLSHGNQKQLELGIALASDPKLLLLDEPTAGMSAAETREAIRLLERVAAERKLTLLFTEHDMDVVFSIAQKIAVLHQGRLIAEGTPTEVRANADVRRVYLGGRS